VTNTDVVIIGAGIIGTGIARELSRYKLKIALLDKESDVCGGASRANNGMIHSGNDPEPGTLKAKHNVIGNRLYSEWAKELKFPFRRIGAWMTARRRDEIPALEHLMEKGSKNGVTDLELITDQRPLKEQEPYLKIVAAVNAPSTAIVSPHLTVVALAENAVRNGVNLLLNTAVTGIAVDQNVVRAVKTSVGFIETKAVVNAAGIYADDVARLAGISDFTIRPRKGEYLLFDKDCSPVRRLIYPAPTPVSKGIGILPTIDGNLLLGPTAVDVDDKEDRSTSEEEMNRILKECLGICPSINASKIISAFAGLRAVADTNDFILGPTKINGFFNAAGIQSPGFSSAPSIATELAANVARYLKADKNAQFVAENEQKIRFSELPLEEKEKLIRQDRRYGHIVCRCEEVTEYEVVEAIHSPLAPRTTDALRTRLRLGMGRCQGAFCLPRVINILQRELNINAGEITLKGDGSSLFSEEDQL
jgi:glycerol-3-phosphate dehydrogenase